MLDAEMAKGDRKMHRWPPYLALVFLAFTVVLLSVRSEGKTLDDNFLYSTVLIQNHSTGTQGTGFVVSRQVGKNTFLLVLVSNRHVLQPKEENPRDTNCLAEATVSFNVIEGDIVSRANVKVTLRDAVGKSFVKDHPNKAVDVAAIIVTPYVKRISPLDRPAVAAISEDRFAGKDFIKKYLVSPGDAAIIIGYPLNLVEDGHVIPIARNALIATKPDYDFRGQPAFLIDCTVLRGSSGSPVILPIIPYIWAEKHKIDIGSIQENHLIGVVSGTMKDWELVVRKVMAPEVIQEITVTDTANLGLVWRSDVISEVLDLFGHKKSKE